LSSDPAASLAIPNEVIWSYLAFALILAIGLFTTFFRRAWQTTAGADKLILLGPLFYAAPLAAFGIEHFTRTKAIASIIPNWIPWHEFWTYLVGCCFVAAALSLVTGIRARLSAMLLALTFFLFVILMHIPAWMRHLENRFALTFVLRELSFSAGALALAASLWEESRARVRHVLATVARYLVAVPTLFFSFEQFMHPDNVPGIPLEPLTPAWIVGHSLWTYLAAVVYAVAGILLLAGKKTLTAAIWLGATVLVVELAVYVPIGIVERASLDNGLNYVADTLMFCGAVLLLAGAMPAGAGTLPIRTASRDATSQDDRLSARARSAFKRSS
jgi:uncharacterized membrane protein YphA (DoxX/SURF4 family)